MSQSLTSLPFTDAEASMASKIRETYIAERSKFESARLGKAVVWVSSRRYDGISGAHPEENRVVSVWFKIARFAAMEGIDAVDYVRWFFESAFGLKSAPSPNALLSKDKASKYKKSISSRRDELYQDLQSQIFVAASQMTHRQKHLGMSRYDSWESVLRDTLLDLSPLFRYCLARSIQGKRFSDIADDFEQRARAQFESSQDAYKASWGDWIPSEWMNL